MIFAVQVVAAPQVSDIQSCFVMGTGAFMQCHAKQIHLTWDTGAFFCVYCIDSIIMVHMHAFNQYDQYEFIRPWVLLTLPAVEVRLEIANMHLMAEKQKCS